MRGGYTLSPPWSDTLTRSHLQRLTYFFAISFAFASCCGAQSETWASTDRRFEENDGIDGVAVNSIETNSIVNVAENGFDIP